MKVNRFRPPAVPLVACDPYFSIWSETDQLTDDSPRHWTGATHGLCGMARIDGVTRRVMGKGPESAPAMTQLDLQVLPTRTLYTFEEAGVRLALTFTTAALPCPMVQWTTWRS